MRCRPPAERLLAALLLEEMQPGRLPGETSHSGELPARRELRDLWGLFHDKARVSDLLYAAMQVGGGSAAVARRSGPDPRAGSRVVSPQLGSCETTGEALEPREPSPDVSASPPPSSPPSLHPPPPFSPLPSHLAL